MQVNNLYLSDFPTHDMAADFVLLAEQWQTAEGALKDQYKVRLPGAVQGSALLQGWRLGSDTGQGRTISRNPQIILESWSQLHPSDG